MLASARQYGPDRDQQRSTIGYRPKTMANTIGYRYVVEASGCNPELLQDAHRIRDILTSSCGVGEMELKSSDFRFAPRV